MGKGDRWKERRREGGEGGKDDEHRRQWTKGISCPPPSLTGLGRMGTGSLGLGPDGSCLPLEPGKTEVSGFPSQKEIRNPSHTPQDPT